MWIEVASEQLEETLSTGELSTQHERGLGEKKNWGDGCKRIHMLRDRCHRTWVEKSRPPLAHFFFRANNPFASRKKVYRAHRHGSNHTATANRPVGQIWRPTAAGSKGGASTPRRNGAFLRVADHSARSGRVLGSITTSSTICLNPGQNAEKVQSNMYTCNQLA